MKRSIHIIPMALILALVISLMSGVALAQKTRWFVIKDKNGNCRVLEAETVAGPFKTRDEADKRGAKMCPKKDGQSSEELRHQSEKQKVEHGVGRTYHRRDVDERRRSPEGRVDSSRNRHKQLEGINHDRMKKQQPSHGEGSMEKTQETIQDKMKETKPMKEMKPMEEKIKDKKRDVTLPNDKP